METKDAPGSEPTARQARLRSSYLVALGSGINRSSEAVVFHTDGLHSFDRPHPAVWASMESVRSGLALSHRYDERAPCSCLSVTSTAFPGTTAVAIFIASSMRICTRSAVRGSIRTRPTQTSEAGGGFRSCRLSRVCRCTLHRSPAEGYARGRPAARSAPAPTSNYAPTPSGT